MILPRYMTAVARIGADAFANQMIRTYFSLPSRRPLHYVLGAAGLGQSDLVLALLRHSLAGPKTWDYVELLVGRPCYAYPPARLLYPVNGHPHLARQPRITYVAPNPRHPKTGAHDRYENFRPGRTVDEALARGATRKDLRSAVRRGWIRVSEHA